MKIQLVHKFEDIINIENLLKAWREFVHGKKGKNDVQEFSLRLMDNIIDLYDNLRHHTYEHGQYQAFSINDPKPRSIHKATVRDRLLHHAIYRVLYPFFARTFIADSYSCQIGKGTHRAINRFRDFACKVSKNNTKTCWILKCDIKKFFASIDHEILKEILRRHIPDNDVMWLLAQVIDSFHVPEKTGVGLPLGNLTSQLLVNIYMNEFDQFLKRKLKVRHYIRYADDFVILHESSQYLKNIIPKISMFLQKQLKLSLNFNKVFVKTLASGADFLGWVHFSDHRVLRTTTKRRMFKKILENYIKETVNSYLGLLTHGNAHKLRARLKKLTYLFN